MAQTRSIHIFNLVASAFFLSLGLVLPFLTGGIPAIGAMLLPMHLPVLICGILIGPKYGALIGLMLPLTRFLIFGMPPLFPTAVSMTFELAAYGAVIGILYAKLPKKTICLYISLIGAMLVGRVVWAAARVVLLGLMETPFSFQIFLMGGFINAWPGILAQIIIVPAIVLALKRAGWQPQQGRG